VGEDGMHSRCNSLRKRPGLDRSRYVLVKSAESAPIPPRPLFLARIHVRPKERPCGDAPWSCWGACLAQRKPLERRRLLER
jgi:hypothetical protein